MAAENGTYDGQTLKKALRSAEVLLETKIEELNALNVFPVPDGDTGINMYLTLRSASEAVAELETDSAAEVAAKAARAALLGARGNSGVILSQIIRGLAKGLEAKERFSADDFAQSTRCAADTAYKAIAKPVEGTILTVIREAADAAARLMGQKSSLKDTLAAMTKQAAQTVLHTPELLPLLKEAGVVDAGGQGLYYVLHGMTEYAATEQPTAVTPETEPAVTVAETQDSYGFDLTFLIEGRDMGADVLRNEVGQFGESVVVVGDENLIKVHIHTQQPQAVLDHCAALGSLKDVELENMDEQVARFQEKSS
ncbi:DAK2 domain-containing protein [Chloroflexota bacterium]